MKSLWRDVGFAARVLWKNPGFTAVAVLAVALGVGANTTIFSVVNALLLRPFAYETTPRVVMVWERGVDETNNRNSVAPANYLDWRDQTKVFEELAAFGQQHFSLNEGEQPERVPGARVTPSLFRVLAARAARGRTFSEEEGRPGAEPVVLIKHSLWRERFGSDPDIVGRSVRIDNRPRTSSASCRRVRFPLNAFGLGPARLRPEDEHNRGNHYLIRRPMRPGVTVDQADAEVRGVAEARARSTPDRRRAPAFTDRSQTPHSRPQARPPHTAGMVRFVLLIACANAPPSRARLFAPARVGRRTALGASRWRLIRHC